MVSPNRGGRRRQTVGVIVHSTRGGQAYGREFEATLRWFASAASQVSAHAVVARSGAVAYPVPDELIAWHAGEHNRDHLGIELEQPAITDDYPEAQLAAAAAIVRRWCERYAIPIERRYILGHSETRQGRRLGKTDPGPTFAWDRFLALIAGEPAFEPATPNALAHLDAAWGHFEDLRRRYESDAFVQEHACHGQDELLLLKHRVGLE